MSPDAPHAGASREILPSTWSRAMNTFPVTTKRQAIALGNLIRQTAEREIQIARGIQADSGRNMSERVVGVRALGHASLRDLYSLLPDKTRAQFSYSCDTYLEAVGMGRNWDAPTVK